MKVARIELSLQDPHDRRRVAPDTKVSRTKYPIKQIPHGRRFIYFTRAGTHPTQMSTCRDLMTKNPVWYLPTATVSDGSLDEARGHRVALVVNDQECMAIAE